MTDFKQAAQELLSRRKINTHSPRLDDSIRPSNIDDALNIHQKMSEVHKIKGWKCLLPPEEKKIIAAPIFNVQHGGNTSILFEENGVARIEPEICFVLSKDLTARNEDYSEQEIIEAIGSTHMALELLQNRFSADAQQSYFEDLADCLTNFGLYIGPEIDKTTAINLKNVAIKIKQEHDTQVIEGTHPNNRAIDGLIWLVNYITKRGITIQSGTSIITGSFKGVINLKFDVETTIEYEKIGKYSLTFKKIK